MDLRERFTAEMKASMKAGDAARTSTLRLILAKLKDTEIAARPREIGEDEVQAKYGKLSRPNKRRKAKSDDEEENNEVCSSP